MREYFPHDYGSRNDPKIQDMIMSQGYEALAIYWCLVEMLYEEGGKLSLKKIKSYAFTLKLDEERLMKVIQSDLFFKNKSFFWSESILERLSVRNQKSLKAKKSAETRWSERNANAMRTHSERNAIKEKKRKEENTKKYNKENSSVALTDYLALFNSLFGSKYTETSGRSKKLLTRLKLYQLPQILQATKNLASSDFHQGKNDRGWKADPDFLISSDEKIDKWLNVEVKKEAKPKENYYIPLAFRKMEGLE